MSFIVASNVIASWPAKHRLTGKPIACAKIIPYWKMGGVDRHGWPVFGRTFLWGAKLRVPPQRNSFFFSPILIQHIDKKSKKNQPLSLRCLVVRDAQKKCWSISRTPMHDRVMPKRLLFIIHLYISGLNSNSSKSYLYIFLSASTSFLWISLNRFLVLSCIDCPPKIFILSSLISSLIPTILRNLALSSL